MSKKLVIDKSCIVSGEAEKLVKKGKLDNFEVLIPLQLVSYLMSLSVKGAATGTQGLRALCSFREAASARGIKIVEVGELSPQYSRELVLELARAYQATVLTSDLPLKLACESIGVECYYISPIGERPKILDYFSSDTMSVHLMCGAPPMAKRGRPGTFKLVRLSDKPLTEEEIREIASELIALAFISKDATIEINREGALSLIHI